MKMVPRDTTGYDEHVAVAENRRQHLFRKSLFCKLLVFTRFRLRLASMLVEVGLDLGEVCLFVLFRFCYLVRFPLNCAFCC